MKRTDNSRKKTMAITLIEVILAMWILFIAICFIFEILRTSYTYVTKLKVISRLNTLSKSKIEQILYDNQVLATDVSGSGIWGSWIGFPEDSSYQYRVYYMGVTCPGMLFPNYTLTQVYIQTRGPVGSTSIPTFNTSLTTILMNYSPGTITSTQSNEWGELPSPEATQ